MNGELRRLMQFSARSHGSVKNAICPPFHLLCALYPVHHRFSLYTASSQIVIKPPVNRFKLPYRSLPYIAFC
jgi:hypothetical protein